ncbi:hypothetical protein [Bartonella sp. LJL80]
MKSLWEGLKARAEPVINFFKTVWGMITSAWSGDMEGMKKYALDALNAVKQYFQNALNDISAIVGKIVDWIQDKLWSMLPPWAQRWLGSDGDVKRAEVAEKEKQKQSASESATIAQQQLKQVDQNNVPANAAEIVKNQNIENNKQTNVTVGSPNVVINAQGDSVQGAKNAADKFGNLLEEKIYSKTIQGIDDARQN